MSIEAWQVPLWDAINRYVVACGGDPSKRVCGNTARQNAVAVVNRVVRDAEVAAGAESDVEAMREVVAIAREVDEVIGYRDWKRVSASGAALHSALRDLDARATPSAKETKP